MIKNSEHSNLLFTIAPSLIIFGGFVMMGSIFLNVEWLLGIGLSQMVLGLILLPIAYLLTPDIKDGYKA